MPANEGLLSEGMGFQEEDYNDDDVDEVSSVWTQELEVEVRHRARGYLFERMKQNCRVERVGGFKLGDLVDVLGVGFGEASGSWSGSRSGSGTGEGGGWVVVESCKGG